MTELEKSEISSVHVAQVQSKWKAVINGGRDKSIKSGQRFLFYSFGEDIFDPITGENLGKLELIRGYGRVIHVQDRVAMVESDNRKRKPSAYGALGMALAAAEYEELPFDDIQVGDIGKPV